MRTLKSGSYPRLASLEALWRGWLDCRRGKRRSPTVAAFELDCDRHLLALQRELIEYRYQPSPWRLHGIRDPKTRLIAAPAVFVGYRISRAGIVPSRKLRRHLRHRLRAAAAKGEESLIRTVRSYRGLLVFP